MGQVDRPSGPWLLVEQLRTYLTSTAWCDWFEVSGSLGRGAGDEHSDVDAGIGVHPGIPLPTASRAALRAVLTFSPVAGALTQPFGSPGGPDHHAVQYRDGRQLSLVVMPATARLGLPHGALAVLDRGQRLQRPHPPAVLTADPAAIREWSFLAWWELGDAAKHLGRGSLWRAVTSLENARRHAWQLHADRVGVEYPVFGAVSVENAGLPAPPWIAATMPSAVEPAGLTVAVRALAVGLGELTADCADPDVVGVQSVVWSRVDPLSRPVPGASYQHTDADLD